MPWSSTMWPTLWPCRVGTRSGVVLSQRSILGLSSSFNPPDRIHHSSSFGEGLTKALTVVHVRRLHRPTQRWNEVRRHAHPKVTTTTTVSSASISTTSPAAAYSRPLSSAIPYSALTVGIPLETYPNERRVAITPQNAALLLNKGFARVLIERGAGAEAQFTDHAYEHAGATLVERKTVWSESNILLKVRAPSVDGPNNEVDALREGGTIISFLYPAQNKNLVDMLASRRATSFAMDMVPRISRAQVFDALRCVRDFSTIE